VSVPRHDHKAVAELVASPVPRPVTITASQKAERHWFLGRFGFCSYVAHAREFSRVGVGVNRC